MWLWKCFKASFRAPLQPAPSLEFALHPSFTYFVHIHFFMFPSYIFYSVVFVIVYILSYAILSMKHIHDAAQASPPCSYRMFHHPKRKPCTKSTPQSSPHLRPRLSLMCLLSLYLLWTFLINEILQKVPFIVCSHMFVLFLSEITFWLFEREIQGRLEITY